MSLEIPVVAIAFGSVTPPQGDVLELRTHLGCTKEVSSFECLLQNFDKKYTVTNPINVGDNCSISIGRGTHCPLILTGRVEEVEPESTPIENYIRVKGRCWGEKIFRRVVTKTYENQKGEAIVRDLIDYYVGLSHTRSKSDLTSDAAAGQPNVVVADASIFSVGMLVKIEDDNAWEYNEVSAVDTVTNTLTMVNNLANTYTVLANGKVWIDLIEKTDTTYTLLEYEDAKVFDTIKYIAESADKSGVIGFDFRVEWDGKFAFIPKNSKTSPVSLSEKIEHSRYSKDIHLVRNRIKACGAAEKPYPLDADGQPWSDSLTEDLTKPDNYLQHTDGKWEPVTGNTNLYIETATVHTGNKSVKIECAAYMYYMGTIFTFNSDKYVNCNRYPKLCFTLREDGNHNKRITISLEDKDGNVCRQTLDIADYDEWQTYELGVGKQNQGSWTMSVFNSGPFDWEGLKKVRLDFHQLSSKHGVAFIDRMHFGGCRWSVTEEDSGSQDSYGLRELVEVDEELHSDHECSLRAKALLDHLSQPAEFLTLRTTCLDYGSDRLLAGDKIHVTLPNENIDSDFRIISVEYQVSARDQALEITLELGKEKPLLADYLYGLRSTTITVEKLMRTKAGLTGIAGGGGGGGGGGMVQHGNEWHDPDFSETDEKVKVSSTDTTPNYLVEKLLAGEGITLTKKNSGADEDLEIKAHRKWSWADEQGQKKCFRLPLVGSSTVGWSRYAGNPVIPAGLQGTYDAYGSMHPSACYSQKLQKFYIAYCGAQVGTWSLNCRHMIIAKSSDGKTGFSSVKILSPTDFLAGSYALQTPSLMYDDFDSKWKIWAALYHPTAPNYYIAYAENSNDDPTSGTWTNKQYFNIPNANNAYIACVTKLGKIYHFVGFDSAYTNLGLCTSYNGISWTYVGVALTKGATGKWDDGAVCYATIFWNLGVWYLIYSSWGSGESWLNSELGMATSVDSIGKTFTRMYVEDGKIFTKGASGQWDDSGVCAVGMLMLDDTFYMYYGGYRSTGALQIGLATLP